jgi:hypothetical protein
MHDGRVSLSDAPAGAPRPPAGTLVGLLADEDRLKVLSAVSLGARSPDEVAEATGLEETAVLKNFLSQGRLTQLPTNRPRRLVVLDFLAGRFELGRRYSENEVAQVLSPLHDDVATLRRYLFDEGMMDRDQGIYWRTGGTVEVRSGRTR